MRRLPVLAILTLVPLGGCAGGDEDSYALVKVSGTITRNGQPLSEAKVSFVPGPGNTVSTPALDQTGPEGNYLLTFKGRTGVAPGKYKVMITQSADSAAGGEVPAEYETQPAMYRMELQSRKRGSAKAHEVKKAGVQTEFDAEVETDAKSKTLDFDVKSTH